MPSTLTHAILDLITFGYPHFDLHKWKDEPARVLGKSHRKERHEWYQAYGVEWTDHDPFPISLSRVIESVGTTRGDSEAEGYMAWAAHDVVDRKWNLLSPAERQYCEGLFVWVLLNPDILQDKFGVDVREEKIWREVDGVRIWEDAPGLGRKYVRVCKYALGAVQKNSALQRMLRQFG